MELWHFVWLLAAVTGLTAAGIAGSGWAMVAGQRPHIWMLADYHLAMPIRALALMVYAPLGLTRAGIETLEENPVFAFMLLGLGIVWSFMQGVFILTTFFGFT